MTYSPEGNYCSICNVHDVWCPHIRPPKNLDSVDPAVKARTVVIAWVFVILFCAAFWMLVAHYNLAMWHSGKVTGPQFPVVPCITYVDATGHEGPCVPLKMESE